MTWESSHDKCTFFRSQASTEASIACTKCSSSAAVTEAGKTSLATTLPATPATTTCSQSLNGAPYQVKIPFLKRGYSLSANNQTFAAEKAPTDKYQADFTSQDLHDLLSLLDHDGKATLAGEEASEQWPLQDHFFALALQQGRDERLEGQNHALCVEIGAENRQVVDARAKWRGPFESVVAG